MIPAATASVGGCALSPVSVGFQPRGCGASLATSRLTGNPVSTGLTRVLASSTPAPPSPSPGEVTTPPCPSYSGHGSGVTLTLTPPILHTPHPTHGHTCRGPLQSSSDHFSVAHRLQSRSRVLLLPCPKACSHVGKGPSPAPVLSPPTVCSPSWL